MDDEIAEIEKYMAEIYPDRAVREVAMKMAWKFMQEKRSEPFPMFENICTTHQKYSRAKDNK